MISQILNIFQIGPNNPEWSAALIALFALLAQGLTFLIHLYLSQKEKKDRRFAEDDLTFIELRRDFDAIWFKLTKGNVGILYKNFTNDDINAIFNDVNTVEEKKTIVFQTIKLLADIHFIYAKQKDNRYWKKWEYIFNHVFSTNLFATAFFKYEQFHGKEFGCFVKKIISKKNKNKPQLKKVS